MKNKKLFKLNSSIMNGTVTMSSSEMLIFADNKQQIEKLIKKAEEKNKDSILKAFERVEEIDKFEVGVVKNNKIKRINIIDLLKKVEI